MQNLLKTLCRRTSLKSFKEFGRVKNVASPCFRQAGVVISPFICFNALGSLDRTKCYPTPCLIHGKFTKAMESPKLSYSANFNWNFHSECMFLSSLSGREWKKLRKISLSSKTSQGEDTWAATIGHRELIICPIDSNGDSLVFDSLFCISEYM